MAGSKFQEKLNAQGRKYIIGLLETAKVLYRKACEQEGIDPAESFVDIRCFGPGNKFYKLHEAAMLQYFEARQQYTAGGYVGLKIGK